MTLEYALFELEKIHNLSYILSESMRVEGLLINFPLLSNRPPKLMSNLLYMEMASAQLPFQTIELSTKIHVQSAIC